MLRLFVLTFIQSIFIFTLAAADTTNSFNVAQFVRESKIRSGFNPRNLSISVVHSPSSSSGISVRQTSSVPFSLGYNWGVTLESLSNFREILGTSAASSTDDTNLYFLNIDPSVSYGIHRTGYILAGLNYAFPLAKNKLGTDLSGSFGYQAGAGVDLSARWNIEAIYRDIGFRGERLATSALAARDLDRLSYAGLLLRASYKYF